MTRIPALLTLLMLGLATLAVPGAVADSDRDCFVFYDNGVCTYDDTQQDSDCEEDATSSFCEDTTTRTRGVQAYTALSYHDVERRERDREREHDYTAGDCTSIHSAGTEEAQETDTYHWVSVPGIPYVPSGAVMAVYGGLYHYEGAGTLVYEDPCGEDLTDGEVAPGTYDYEYTRDYVRAGTIFWTPQTGYGHAAVDAWQDALEARHDDDPDNDVCYEEKAVRLTLVALGEALWPTVRDSDDEC